MTARSTVHGARPLLASLLLVGLILGCATTVHDDGPAAETWRAPGSAAGPAEGERLATYVATFGLAPSVAKRWPELERERVGFGLAQRVVEALWDHDRFTFYEEKAEMAARLSELLGAGDDPGSTPDYPDVPWLLYGEVVNLEQRRREQLSGLAARQETETRVTVQLRLVARRDGRVFPATGEGVAAGRQVGSGLDAGAVSKATQEAVEQAAAALARVVSSR